MRINNAVVKKDTPSPALPGILSLQGRGKQVVPFAPLREKVGGARMRGHLHGFTLIELLVVVLIIGILAAVAVPQYQVAVEKSHAVSVLPLMRSILNAQQSYILANGSGTYDISQLDIHFPHTKITGYTSYSRRYHLNNQAFLLIYSNSERIIYAKYKQGNENDTEYTITLERNGTGTCKADATKWTKLCKSLGTLKEGSTITYEFSF